MFSSPQNSVNTFDITDVAHLERIVVGSVNPEQIPSEEDNQDKINQINRCLKEYPKGRIIGVERNFSIIRIGEHQVVLEAVVYHIGFKKVPLWLTTSKESKPSVSIDPKKIEQIMSDAKSE